MPFAVSEPVTTPVICTPAVSNASGTDADESRIYLVNRQLGRLFTSPMRTRIATQVGIATVGMTLAGALRGPAVRVPLVCPITTRTECRHE